MCSRIYNVGTNKNADKVQKKSAFRPKTAASCISYKSRAQCSKLMQFTFYFMLFIVPLKHLHRTFCIEHFFKLTLVSPSGARGSVIHDPYLEPDVLIVTGSLIPVSFPHAANNK